MRGRGADSISRRQKAPFFVPLPSALNFLGGSWGGVPSPLPDAPTQLGSDGQGLTQRRKEHGTHESRLPKEMQEESICPALRLLNGSKRIGGAGAASSPLAHRTGPGTEEPQLSLVQSQAPRG